MKRALLVGLAVCALGALGWALQYAIALRDAMAPPRPTTYVQAGWSVYRFGPGHVTHVGTQSLDCTACHRSTEEGKFDRPGPGGCVDCHETRAGIDHALVGVDEAGHRLAEKGKQGEVSDCMRCHGFGPDPEQKPSDCLGCHAQSQGSEPAVELHADQACTSCHDVHENSVTPLSCQKCHSMAVQHGKHGPGDPAQCLDCHRAHASADVAVSSCRDCHGPTGEPAVPETATAKGHSCTGCHTPHGFAKTQVAACQSCHADQHTLSGAGHGECTSCHTPHAVSSVKEQNVCLNCHRDVALSHDEKVDPIAACTGCHLPHPDKSQNGPSDCTSCHSSIAKSDVSAHTKGVRCVQCHTPHGFVLEKAAMGHGLALTTCKSCHAARVEGQATHPGHGRCESCHQALPHGGDPKPSECGSCHEEQAKAAHASSQAGHTKCLSCHDAHTGARIKQCAECHAEPAAHLSKKHGPCQSCHEEHSASFLPSVQNCSACHNRSSLSGLHEVKEHAASCASCHGVHAVEKAAEPSHCLSCHQDKQDHQPTATRCDGCHAFRPSPGKGKLP